MFCDDTCSWLHTYHILVCLNGYKMICDCYVICDEMIYLRYDMLRYNMFDDVLMIWYVNIMIYDMTWYVCIIWFGLCLTWLTYKKKNDELVQDTTPIYAWQVMIKWYDTKENAKGVVVHDNERKNVGNSCIILCSCIGGYPFSIYDTDRKMIIILL